tara:strand:+ start:3949 stop:4941 length:993 start_codon:yes stop_codon:yes gene_type:complete
MDPNPKISICIPVFNGEKYIKNCIDSVLNQDFKDFEILVLDNCSTDGTKRIIQEIEDKRIQYFRNESNIGSIKNFNKCIEKAKSKYFLLLPHDDTLLPASLNAFYSILEDRDVSFVYSSVQTINSEGKDVHLNVNHQEDKFFTSLEGLRDIVENFVPIQLAMARTSDIKESEGFDDSFGPFCDVKLWIEILSKGKNCYYSSSPLSCHRVHPEQGQIAFLDNDIQIIGRHWGKKLTKEFLLKNNYSFLFLRLISFTKISFSVSEQNSHDLIRLLASHFAYSNLKRTYQSLKKINIFMLVIELRSLFHFIQELGLMEMLVCYYMAIKRYIKT